MTAVKTIETRSWPAPAKWDGQTLIIHAAKRIPVEGRYGPWSCSALDRRRGPVTLHRSDSSGPGRPRGLHSVTPLPLGAVVGSARLAGCVPIKSVDETTADHQAHIHEARHAPGRLLLAQPSTGSHTTGSECFEHFEWATEDISSQLPYGDFAPGRWAWLLEDAAPTTERCPACMGHCIDVDARSDPRDGPPSPCPLCQGAGKCDPIPARGGQRIWRWNGLPALTLWQPWASLCVTEAP